MGVPRHSPLMPGRLAACAFDLFAEHGFDDVTIDQIAAAADVTKGSFYSHYKSKQEVIYAACDHYYTSYLEAVQRELVLIEQSGDGGEEPIQVRKLRRVLEFSVRSCVLDKRNCVFTTEVLTRLSKDPCIRDDWAQFYSSVREMYLQLLFAAAEVSDLEADGAREAVDLMLNAMEGIKLRASFEPQIGDEDEQKTLVAGLWQILATSHSPMPAGREE